MLFLVEQFERLRERRDPGLLGRRRSRRRRAPQRVVPACPKTSASSPACGPKKIQIYRDGVKLAHLTGWSRPPGERIRPGDFRPDAGGLFSIARRLGRRADRRTGRPRHSLLGAGRQCRPADHLAVRRTRPTGPARRRDAGFDEVGPHGCTVVHGRRDGHGPRSVRRRPTPSAGTVSTLPIDSTHLARPSPHDARRIDPHGERHQRRRRSARPLAIGGGRQGFARRCVAQECSPTCSAIASTPTAATCESGPNRCTSRPRTRSTCPTRPRERAGRLPALRRPLRRGADHPRNRQAVRLRRHGRHAHANCGNGPTSYKSTTSATTPQTVARSGRAGPRPAWRRRPNNDHQRPPYRRLRRLERPGARRSSTAGLTLLYGENETGKTTLLEFVRSVLYGYNEERRAKYLPPVHGGVGGGMLGVETHAGKFRIRRRAEGDLDGRPARPDQPTRHGARRPPTEEDPRRPRRSRRSRTSSRLGLGEIQELGTLSGAGAAEFLYDLAVGSGGVSLTEVQRELEKSRTRLFSSERNSHDRAIARPADGTARRYRTTSPASAAATRCWPTRRERLADDVERCEVEADEIRRTADLLEAAISVFERWHRRDDVADRSWPSSAKSTPIPDEAWHEAGATQANVTANCARSIDKLKKERADAESRPSTCGLNKLSGSKGRGSKCWRRRGWIEQSGSGNPQAREPSSYRRRSLRRRAGRRETLSGEWVKLGLTPSSAEKLGDRKLLKSLYRAFRERRDAEKRLNTAAETEARQRELRRSTPPKRSRSQVSRRVAARRRRRSKTSRNWSPTCGSACRSIRRSSNSTATATKPSGTSAKSWRSTPFRPTRSSTRNTAFVVGCLLFFTGSCVPENRSPAMSELAAHDRGPVDGPVRRRRK